MMTLTIPLSSGIPPATVREPLGVVHVTRYTHNEGGRLTASGYYLKDSDQDKVCAVSRDWWKHSITPGDLVFVDGFVQPCVVLDTMAVANRKGKRQLHWIDLYSTSVEHSLDFGIQHRKAWLVRR